MSARYPTLQVASTITGVVLGDGFSPWKAQEISSKLIGRSVWTHELAHKPTQEAIRAAGYRLFPLMPTKDEALADWQAAAVAARKAYGEFVTIPDQPPAPASDPIETLGEAMNGGSSC